MGLFHRKKTQRPMREMTPREVAEYKAQGGKFVHQYAAASREDLEHWLKQQKQGRH